MTPNVSPIQFCNMWDLLSYGLYLCSQTAVRAFGLNTLAVADSNLLSDQLLPDLNW